MRLSVYVADDLWEQAQEVDPTKATSALVQEALRDYIANHAARPAFTQGRPSGSDELLAKVAGRLERQARERYEQGYKHGLELAGEITWADFDTLASVRWDLEKWWKIAENAERVSIEYIDEGRWFRAYTDKDDEDKASAKAIGRVLDEGFEHQSIYRAGVVAALKEVWASVSGEPAVTDDRKEGGGKGKFLVTAE